MTERQIELTPEEVEEVVRERIERAEAAKQLAETSKANAVKMAAGSWLLGLIAAFKILGAEGGELYVWLGVFGIAFGLASVQQVLKAFGKGQ